MKKTNFISRFKYRTFLGLVALYIAVIFNLTWMWGVFFLFWVILDLINGTTHLFETIHRAESPIWYWLIVGSWVWMSIYLILAPFLGWRTY